MALQKHAAKQLAKKFGELENRVRRQAAIGDKNSARVLAGLYEHAKSELEYLEDARRDLDHPEIVAALEPYRKNFVEPRVEMLRQLFETHHADGDIDELNSQMQDEQDALDGDGHA